jgi:hypothetical protein
LYLNKIFKITAIIIALRVGSWRKGDLNLLLSITLFINQWSVMSSISLGDVFLVSKIYNNYIITKKKSSGWSLIEIPV